MNINGENLKSEGKNNVFIWCLDFVRVLFHVLLSTYLLLILVESLFAGSVSSYLDLDLLLIEVIAVGIAAVLSAPVVSNSKTQERLNKRNKFLILCAGVGAAVTIWYKIQDIGWISFIISILGGGLIVFLTTLTWQGDKGEEIEEKDSQNN